MTTPLASFVALKQSKGIPRQHLETLDSFDPENPEFLYRNIDNDWQNFRAGWLAAAKSTEGKPATQTLAEQLFAQLCETNTPNFLEVTYSVSGAKYPLDVVVTLQHPDRKTPGELLAEAKAEIEHIRSTYLSLATGVTAADH